MRLFGGIGGLPLMFTLRSSSAQRKKRNARGTSCTPMAPDAGPFSCSPEAFPARLTNKDVARSATELENRNAFDMMKFQSNIINNLYCIMNTRETLILKTLSWKETLTGSGHGSTVDYLLEENPEKADEITKNVCARIPLQLAQEMETLGNMLDLNKREIITMALIDFLEKARDTLTEFKAWPDDVEEGK